VLLGAVYFRRCCKYRNTINAPWHIIVEWSTCWRGEARSHQRSVSGHGKSIEALVEAVDHVLAMARVESTDASHAKYVVRRKDSRDAAYRYGWRQLVRGDKRNHGAVLASDEELGPK
jgi:hypothetical protein